MSQQDAPKKPFEFGPLQTKWLEELESGKHAQAREILSCSSGMCCLGVAVKHVLEIEPVRYTSDDPEWGAIENATPDDEWVETFNDNDVNLNAELADRLGLKSRDGNFLKDGLVFGEVRILNSDSLVELNDNGATFQEIAKVIRENPELIFKESR